jgi:hypothetical protein
MISVPIIVRNAVKLKYPLDRVVRGVIGLADEIVISVDPTSDDDTLDYVYDIMLDVNYTISKQLVRMVSSIWNISNITSNGLEFANQTNIAIKQCTGDWIISLQAEKDFNKIKASIMTANRNGVDAFSTVRIYFYGDMDTIREDWTVPIIRIYRKGSRVSSGDAMNTEGSNRVVSLDTPMYHYSRIGDPKIISKRISSLDHFFHPSEKLLEENELKPYDFSAYNFDCTHKDTVDVGRKKVEGNFKKFSGIHPMAFRNYKG